MCDIDNTDFRDLLVESLTENGTLAKIRAELRARVYLTLDNELDLKNEPKRSCLKNDYAAVLFLIHDFLNNLEFEYTLSVFEAESSYTTFSHINNREDFFKNFSLTNTSKNEPALLQVFQIFKKALVTDHKASKFDTTYELPSDSKSCPELLTRINDSTKSCQNTASGLLNNNASGSDITEEIHTTSADNQIRTETEVNKYEIAQISFDLEETTSDLILFKDLHGNNLPKNSKHVENDVLEETLIMNKQVEGKFTEMTSSSPLTNEEISINLMKFEDSFGDISVVKTSEITNNEIESKTYNTDINKSLMQAKQAELPRKPESILTLTDTRISKRNEFGYIKDDISNKAQNFHTFCDSPTKNICKQKLDNINSTSLPSFYVNISNIEDFEIDMDSLDNYEEDILSLSTASASQENPVQFSNVQVSEITSNSDRVPDRSLFTVSGLEVSNPEMLTIGDGPLSEIEKTDVKGKTINRFP